MPTLSELPTIASVSRFRIAWTWIRIGFEARHRKVIACWISGPRLLSTNAFGSGTRRQRLLTEALVSLLVGLTIAVAFGVIIEAGNVTGGEPWARLPLLGAGLALAGASLGGLGALLGALAREARTASLVALLVVLPIVFLGLVPREVVPVAGVLSDALPFAHAVRLFASSLYDARPWAAVGREAAWLAGLGLAFAAAARLGARRLLA